MCYFKIVRCLTCGHIQIDPLPQLDDDLKFYQSNSQTKLAMGEVDYSIEEKKSIVDTTRRVKWLNSISPANNKIKVLDIGCGYGFFVNALSIMGYTATGIDISIDRLTFAQSHLKGSYINGTIDRSFISKNKNFYDFVTLFHVLEHVHDPVNFLKLIYRLLAPGGKLLIEVPNVNDELVKKIEPYQKFYWQRAHLSYFDKPRLELAFRRANFKIFTILGLQRYGLRNLLHWLDTGKPQLKNPDYYLTEPAIAYFENEYGLMKERNMTSDTMIAEVFKSN